MPILGKRYTNLDLSGAAKVKSALPIQEPTMRIVHPDGEWLVNRAQFAFTDPTTNTTFQPGEVTKATLTDWIKSQPTFAKVPDPLAKPTEKAAKKA